MQNELPRSSHEISSVPFTGPLLPIVAALLALACGARTAGLDEESRNAGDSGSSLGTIGEPCTRDSDCEEICSDMGVSASSLTGGLYPDGMCTQKCSTPSDCPEGTWCVGRAPRNMCAVSCEVDADCDDLDRRTGRDYRCVEESTPNEGDATVCGVPD